ncbi:ElyC/SanA/YdcF family protein [Vibrio sp. Of7-15]|uniref:SanA/YdcF family protein n=1 Tax=Vibrio sp. Of7-15 TaxID=2724879 RepID=UPI0031BB9B79
MTFPALPNLWQKLRVLKRALLFCLALLTCMLLGMLLIDTTISFQGSDRVFQNIDDLPERDVALVLGTSKYIGRQLNPFYQYRIDAAIKLHQLKRVKNFLLSGDNAHRSYNEPWTMKRDLLKAGIEDKNITLDYAGFRTLDSIVRAKEVFEANHFVIISQKFHCERALFIANHYDIDSVCLAVPSPEGLANMKIRMREILARTKAVLDLYVLNVQPKFLGPKEPISIQESPQ